MQRPRKHTDGKKLKKKNSKGVLVYDVKIVSGDYDNIHHKWMYTLKDHRGDMIKGETEEGQLG